ncbi:hypothetical protein [Natrarchaeobaculum aegyptiacum]|uniref:Uncharacterized protein n=1 Tax=Natrarchaeobaculum aegyptiacum TaxID=745377 RepID=A0A2Z2HV26_9EURY|nr:hypothetical protein [Natrarchaeobaculum aegyptiacum]ARS89377.1 hypothetical protein B1756_06190 [Natrarchaeobaculum aegyptiacum]
MEEDTTADDAASIDDPTDSLDLECTERVEIGVTRGETDLEMGPPRDYPDRADVAVRPVADDGDRIVLSIDAMAGDHATGHADVTLTPAEARTLRDHLERTVRWMAGSDGEGADE